MQGLAPWQSGQERPSETLPLMHALISWGSRRGGDLPKVTRHNVEFACPGCLPPVTESPPRGSGASPQGRVQEREPGAPRRRRARPQLPCVRRESGNSSWEIPRASKAEEGAYQCSAVSRAGTGQAEAQVVVTGRCTPSLPPSCLFPLGFPRGVSPSVGRTPAGQLLDCPSSGVHAATCSFVPVWAEGPSGRKAEGWGSGHAPPAQLGPTPGFLAWPLGRGRPPDPFGGHRLFHSRFLAPPRPCQNGPIQLRKIGNATDCLSVKSVLFFKP